MIYVIHPGLVYSINDKEMHYINYSRLIELYCLNPRECINAERRENLAGLDKTQLKHIYPRRDGRYPIFENRMKEK